MVGLKQQKAYPSSHKKKPTASLKGGAVAKENVGELISGTVVAAQLRLRNQINHFQTVPKKGTKKGLLESDGWVVAKENKSTFRMAKEKPYDEKLEDEIWVVLARMGFEHLSKGRHFKVKGRGGASRQIDVFAADSDSAVFVECTGRDKPGKKPLNNLIEKICSERKAIHSTISSHFKIGSKLKQRWIIATRNVIWRDVDLEKAKNSNIFVLRDEDIDYYKELVGHLGIAARFQFLAEIFTSEEIPGLSIEVPATRGKMGGTEFYNFLVHPIQLLKIGYVSHKSARSTDALVTYQRMLRPKRLKDIANYINEGGRFPTNVVINIDKKKRRPLRFDVKSTFGDSSYGTLHLPNRYRSAWIIDGQHRLYGYAKSFRSESATLPVLAFEGLPATEQARMFVDINHEQVRVSKNLLIEIVSDLHWDSPDPDAKMVALASKISQRLDKDIASPLRNRIVSTGKRKDHFRCLSLTSVSDALVKQNLVGRIKGEFLLPGPITCDGLDKALRKALDVISGFLGKFAQAMPDHWALGDDVGGYLCTNNAITALFRVLRAICDDIDRENGITCDEMSATELLKRLDTYIEPLIAFLQSATPEELKRYRNQVGIKGQRSQSLGLMSHIREKQPTFNPPGLQEYIDSWDEQGTEEAIRLIHSTQRRLFHGMIEKLKNYYGQKESEWWRQGVPEKVRTDCAARSESDPQGLPKERQLFLIDYKSIAAANWTTLFEEDFQFYKPEGNRRAPGKEKQLKAIVELNRIRNIVDHPERGNISKDELVFIRELAKHFEHIYCNDSIPATQ